MQYVITPYAEQNVPPVYYWESAFSSTELDYLSKIALSSREDASTHSLTSTVVNKDIRRSKITWMKCDSDKEWVFERLSHVVSAVNANVYRFNLAGFGEPIQMTLYESNDSGTYGWHSDFGSQISRKLSLVMQLSDPSEYEGGNLEILIGNKPVTLRKQRGLIALFPSYVTHRVTPVTSGFRTSLVSWVSGEPFR